MKEVLTSKKFYALVVGLIVLLIGDRAGLTADQITGAVEVLMAYILGQGIADTAKGKV